MSRFSRGYLCDGVKRSSEDKEAASLYSIWFRLMSYCAKGTLTLSYGRYRGDFAFAKGSLTTTFAGGDFLFLTIAVEKTFNEVAPVSGQAFPCICGDAFYNFKFFLRNVVALLWVSD